MVFMEAEYAAPDDGPVHRSSQDDGYPSSGSMNKAPRSLYTHSATGGQVCLTRSELLVGSTQEATCRGLDLRLGAGVPWFFSSLFIHIPLF